MCRHPIMKCVLCNNETWFCVSRLQTGMRGAFGKPLGTVARVRIGQVIMSVRTKASNKEHIIEALRRAKFKFPGRQKVYIHFKDTCMSSYTLRELVSIVV